MRLPSDFYPGTSSEPEVEPNDLRRLLMAELKSSTHQAVAHEAVARELAGQTDVDSIIERELAEACAAHARAAAEEAEHALARLADGTYGTCESCGAVIPPERLAVIPHARLCVACLRAGPPAFPRRFTGRSR